jgi:hypothetical protein
MRIANLSGLLLALFASSAVFADDGHECWLPYEQACCALTWFSCQP